MADVRCGEGWSAISIALGYPACEIDGYDIDEPSITAAKRNASSQHVAERVSFAVADADPQRLRPLSRIRWGDTAWDRARLLPVLPVAGNQAGPERL